MTQIRSGLVAVVTGAGSGVGEAVATALASEGVRVALVGRTTAKLGRVQQLIAASDGECAAFPCDVAQPQAVAELREDVIARFGDPHVLFNAAGIACEALPIAETTPERWLETMAINTNGPYLTARAFLPGMLRRGWGRIINVSSAASVSPPWSVSAVYQLSKVTLNWFTRQLAAEIEGSGVTANAIHPGEVKTEMWAAIKAEASRRTGAGRAFLDWAEWVEETGGDPPQKTVDLVLELLAPAGDAVNGQFLWIKDGLQEARPAW